MTVYLDHAATTTVRPAAVATLASALSHTGNASSVHSAGRDARRMTEAAREQLASAFGCAPGEVVFLASGTEADNLAVKGLYFLMNGADAARRVVVTSAIEHPAVRETAGWLAEKCGAEWVELPVTSAGVVDLDAATELLKSRAAEVAVLSVIWASNELGTLQPIAELAALASSLGIPMHSDAVQAAAHESIDFAALGLAALSISGHKLGAPQGIAALIVGRQYKLEPLLHGGLQERSMRSGTVPAGLIAALGVAVAEVVDAHGEQSARLRSLRRELESGVLEVEPDAVINGVTEPRMGGMSSITFPGCDAQALLIALDRAGVAVSAGSACAAGTLKPSYVLSAIGLDKASARSTIRVSLGWPSTADDVAAFLLALPVALQSARVTTA